MRYCNLSKKFPIQTYGIDRNFLGSTFSEIKKKHQKSISFVFQAIFFKYLGNVPIITKKRYVGILIILKNKKIIEKIIKKSLIFSKKKVFLLKIFLNPT